MKKSIPSCFQPRWTILVWGLLCMCLLCACAGEASPGGTECEGASSAVTESGEATRELFAMDTYMTPTAYGPDAEGAVEEAEAEIQRLDALWSVGSEESETSRLNREGGGSLSPKTAKLVEQSLALFRDTEGAFDITIFPLMEEWGFISGVYRVPEEETIQNLLEQVGSDALDYDRDAKTIAFPQGVQVDFGAIAKGYTSQRIMDIFEAHGCTSGVVSLGGNAQTFRAKEDGSPWRVGIENPDPSLSALSQSEYVGVVSVKDKAVITSGGYERYFEQDGERYHHILDPQTGHPARSGLISVSIVSPDGCLADGLSTALFVMGKDKALEYWRVHREEFDAILVEEDGSVTITQGLEECFSSDVDFTIEREAERGEDT